MQDSLVTLQDGQAVTTSLAIAEGVGIQHKNVLELIRIYIKDLEQLGGVAFETRPFETKGGTQTREIAWLNERQATLILSYMRNSEVVRQFKLRLVTRFYEMAERIFQRSVDKEKIDYAAAIASLEYHKALTGTLIEMGVDKGMANAQLLNCVERETGIDHSEYRKILPGRTEPLENLNATQVGQLLGVSAQQANKLLEEKGLQFKNERNEWELTDKGMQYAALRPYQNNGHSGYQVLWRRDVVGVFETHH